MSNENDPLVEAVARAMVDAYESQFGPPDHVSDGTGSRWKAFALEARAAIKAVLEWHSDPENVTSEMLAALHRESVLGNGPRRVLASVTLTELKRMEG